jgi:hypothetical protein
MLRYFLAIFLAAALPMFAQQGRGTILGTVTDASGAAVPAVSVIVTNTDTNSAFRTETNGDGFYTSPGIPIGNYEVVAERSGFKKTVRNGIVLQVDQKAQVDMVLQVGAVAESVEVTGEVALVDTSSATVGKVVEQRRVTDLPVNGRSAFALMLLAPAVKPTASPTQSGFADRGIQLSQVSINGGVTGLNSFVVDGGNNSNSYYPDINANPAVDAVEEFKVQSNTMSAEFGFTLGGVVNLVTKSGTNSAHGTLYEFARNSAFDARNTFSSTKTKFTYNQYGGSFGGPVVLPKLYDGRNKTFFFANYEEYRYAKGSSTISTVPTDLQRQGDYSQTRDSSGTLIGIYDPDSTTANTSGSGYVRTAFAGNVIPSSRLDPVALKALSYLPSANRTPSNAYTNADNNYSTQTSYTNMQQFTTRGDHRISDADQVSFRYSYFRQNIPAYAGGLVPAALGARVDDFRTHNFLLAETHAFSPSMVNDFRVSVARQYFTFIGATYNDDWPAKLGLPSSVPSYTAPIFNGIAGWSGGGSSVGVRGALTWQFIEALTVVRGGHTMKFGGDFRVLRGNNYQMANPSGSFSFGGTANPQSTAGTGNTYAAFVLGAVSSASITTYLGQSQKGYSASGFFQDDWRVSRRLTLNLGLRYDFQSPPVEANRGNSNFDPFGINPDNGLPGRVVYAGVDYGDTALQPYYKDFGPRFGFAYDVFGTGTTVVRGGYSIFYSPIFNISYFGNTQGFSTTGTSYNPANSNSNYIAFHLKDGLPSTPTAPQGSLLGHSAWLSTGESWDQSNQAVPMSQQWSASIQQRLPKSILLDVTYTGNHGTHLSSGSYDFNQMDPKYYSNGLALQNTVTNPYVGMVPGTLGGSTLTLAQSLRPYPYISSISVRNPNLGNSIYHAVLISVEKRLANGLTILGSFTGGKLISDSVATPLNWYGDQTNITGYQNGKYHRDWERSLDPTDVSRRLVLSGIYEMPFGKGRRWNPGNAIASKIVSGWQVNSIATFQTGLPLRVTGASNNLADRPNSTGKSAKLDNPTAAKWFDTSAFVNPASYTYGNVGRVLADVRDPGVMQIDLSLIKDTHVTEKARLQFRAEAFNVTNKVNLGLPNSSFSPGTNGLNVSSTFGTITSARDPRQVQLALKLIF